MDLVYTTKDREDINVLHNYNADHETSTETDKNTFELTVSLEDNPLAIGQYWYCDGEEYGGRIDALKIDTKKNKAFASGRTWRGILGSKVLIPNGDYYTVNGDANAVIGQIIERVGLSALFKPETALIKPVQYQFKRYCDAYSGIVQMLAEHGLKLSVKWSKGNVILSAVDIKDWDNETEISTDMFDFVIEQNKGAINHIIGLGQGELHNRQVVHRYIDGDGNVGTTPFYTGIDEIVYVYDYPNVESLDELIESTEEKLLDLAIEDGLKVTTNIIEADLGDKFTAYERNTGVKATEYVTRKIATFSEENIKINYEVGAI